MRTRLVAWAAPPAAAALRGPARPAERAAAKAAGKPTLVVRVESIDRLLDDVRYLIELSGRGGEAKQLEGFLKAQTGDQGLQGIDTGKPLGLYARLGPKGAEDSQAVLLLPITDQKALLDLLERLNVKAEEGKGGVYTAKLEKV